MTEEQFRESIRKKYAAQFQHIYALQEFAQTAMLGYRTLTSTHYQASLWLIFGRAYKSYDSIRRLCELASCEDAGIILRSLLNLMVVTRWISVDSENRSKRYFDWYWVSLKNDAENSPGRVPPAWIPTIQKGYDRVKTQFEYQNTKGHTKVAKQWYQPEARTIRELFEQVGMKDHYEEAYGPLSAIEHSDINAFFAMTRGIDKTSDERPLEIQNDLMVPHYLRNAFQYFADIFRICNATNPLADKAKLEEIIETGLQFYAEDMMKRGMHP